MDDFERIVENEAALQRPQVRRDRAAVRALLDPAFIEVDRTGRAWDAEGVIEALAGQVGYVQQPMTEVESASLAPGVVLLTYRDDTIMHSSVWVRDGSGEWLLRYHQQTAITD
ncbi:nuclear transport factor 2 family protein [Actinoplanes sp. TBRC 11911]|uniref:DUF4440 domain-containing protein n=1 Tax=Actinoplanes sp. TBRC 11911 TaxID=2729386 RepID=UPI00145DB5F6|nr:DUF4440 domain-containing protein [Actinoplanes sp. TBRC 11911]NMO49734.1 nuclear transport factor 2 family protein [Actinoplanes sp. TBRC 11911]